MEFTWAVQHQSNDVVIQGNRNHTNDLEESSSVIGHSAARRLLAIAGD